MPEGSAMTSAQALNPTNSDRFIRLRVSKG
jgi:hypothetical protein